MAQADIKLRRLGLDHATLTTLAAEYHQRWRLDLVAVDAAGRVLATSGGPVPDAGEAACRLRVFAINEALRWGEPTIAPVTDTELICWAVPLMRNAQVLGGLVVYCSEDRLALRGVLSSPQAVDSRQACTHLRALTEEYNLTNAAVLEVRRSEYQREQQRAEAIHAFKAISHFNLRALYLLDEPELIAAVRRGDRGKAREILNRLLVVILHQAGNRPDLVKSFFMELVATMTRTAVEAGGAPEELLGANFTNIAALSRMRRDEELAPWLHEMLERVMDAIHRYRTHTPTILLADALDFITRNCAQQITRDDAAKVAHLSPSYFSRLFKKQLGQSFNQVLNQKRVAVAVDLLAGSDKSLKVIALEAGFADQSYFTKVFRKLTGQTPLDYRQANRPQG